MIRYRLSFNGKLILQVNVPKVVKEPFPSQDFAMQDNWKDATFQDYQLMAIASQMTDQEEPEEIAEKVIEGFTNK